MTEAHIVRVLTETHALLTGHFLLRSGSHSDRYFQAALVLQHTLVAQSLCGELAERFANRGVETVISPAVGGIVVGQEIGRQLGVKAIFAEKNEISELVLRRGFALSAGEKVLVAEDVITRGGRVRQTVDLVRSCGADVVGIAVLVDRSDGSLDFGAPLERLVKLDLTVYPPEACPLCARGLPVEKPGSG